MSLQFMTSLRRCCLVASKLKIVIFSGCDASGKSTVKRALEKASNYKYVCLDRFSDSVVYDRLFGREQRTVSFMQLEGSLSSIADVLLVYLDCSDMEVLLERLHVKCEDEITVSSISSVKRLFEEYLLMTPLSFIVLDTSKLSVAECVELIISKLEEK